MFIKKLINLNKKIRMFRKNLIKKMTSEDCRREAGNSRVDIFHGK